MKKIFTYLATLILSCMFLPIAEAQSTEGIKVISYNIWNGFDLRKDESRRDDFIEWVNAKSPDVLALQELCGYTEATLLEDAKKWGHDYVVILKEDGYPVGLTSSKPIEVKEKMIEGFWHGMLHCETWDIDFFVVHLSPFSLSVREKEAKTITEKIREVRIQNPHYIVLGDFNSHSPFDGDLDKQHSAYLEHKRKEDKQNQKHKTLMDGEFDYGVVSTFLSVPLIDICQRYVSDEKRFTVPTPVNGKTPDEIEANKHRIDFMLVSPELAKKSITADIFNGIETQALSDHYPISASFDLK